MNITMGQARKVAEQSGTTLHPNYSGRFMYGATCVGFSGDNTHTVALALVDVLGMDAARAMTEGVLTDSLGLGTIVYYMGIEVEDE